MSPSPKNSFTRVPDEYKAAFQQELLKANVNRMHGLAIYMVVMQVILQLVNVLLPQQMGEGVTIPLAYYILLSLVTLVIGTTYWILLAQAKRDKIKSPMAKKFLVNSLLYLYLVIQMSFHTMNILSRQGLNSYIILLLIIGMIPILPVKQSILTIAGIFSYTILLMFATRHITDSRGVSEISEFLQSDMRVMFPIITGITTFISIVVFRMFVSNFIKTMDLASSNSHLETLVQKRTKELEDKTVIAEAASLSKSQFLANMSHEIRTPLNAIIGTISILASSNDIERHKDGLKKINTASIHLLGVINDILDMSKIEADKFELSSESFDFAEMMNSIATVINGNIQNKRQKFTVDVDPNIPHYLIGDRQRLAQIVTNLLSNAVKFTPEEGEITLSAHLVRDENGQTAFRISVTDTGIGISEEQMSRLFTAFEQADNNISRKFGGTGLGLAISKRIIELMGGSIQARSVIGHGSTFSIEVSLPHGEVPEIKPDEVSAETCDFTGKTILIAEDIEINREIIAALLESTNITIEFACNGTEAVDKFISQNGVYDLIFMDIHMPEMDGYEATRRIRAHEKTM
ncbi:MAG: response regulator, partial [Treponema sp.]|nr:response regulator [Treponema sp.]